MLQLFTTRGAPPKASRPSAVLAAAAVLAATLTTVGAQDTPARATENRTSDVYASVLDPSGKPVAGWAPPTSSCGKTVSPAKC